MNTFDQTVQTTSGSAAARVTSTPLGTGSSCPAGDRDLLGVAAAPEQRAHLVAHGPAGDPGAERGDPSGALQAGVGGGAGRRVVEALPLEDVGAVDGPGHDVDQHLPLTGHGIRHLAPDQRLGPTGFRNRDRIHGLDATRSHRGRPTIRPQPEFHVRHR